MPEMSWLPEKNVRFSKGSLIHGIH